MAENANARRLALDTNIPIDLADDKGFAFEFLDAFQEQGFSFLLPPTAVEELDFIYRRDASTRKRALALKALKNLRAWGIIPFELTPVERGYAEEFCKKLHRNKLLPTSEKNDAFILAETSIKKISGLVTSDTHLLGMDTDGLQIVFRDSGLGIVTPSHPKKLVHSLNRFRR